MIIFKSCLHLSKQLFFLNDMKLTEEDIQAIHNRIQPYIKKTPVITNNWINEHLECEMFFKCENLQKVGAFKVRGAFNAVLNLSTTDYKKGVTTHSSGNHAQALALAAQTLGIKATIVMPENSPLIKIRGVEELGATIVKCRSTFEDRVLTLNRVIEETGAVFIPPFDHVDVIQGQATCAYEMLQDHSDLNAILAPIGGGGLISGTCLTVNAISPKVKVYGSEPENMDDAYRSLKTGHLQTNPSGKTTIADGLRTDLGELTFKIMQEHLTDIFLVSEEEIQSSMKMLWERLKIIIEPSSAVPFAAMLKNKSMFKGQKVGIIITGGNVDLENIHF